MATLTLVHNPTAGIRPVAPRILLDLLSRIGFRVRYISSKRTRDLRLALRHTDGLIAVAGGDGTVAEVIHATADRPVMLGLIPSGVANNIATSLGIHGPPARAIAGWARYRPVPLHRAIVRLKGHGSWPLMESIGIGALAEAARATPHHGTSAFARTIKLAEARRRVARAVAAAEVIPGLKVNGEDLSGRAIFFEIMMIPLTGPNLCLAHGFASGGDAMRAVYAGEEHRDALVAWLDAGARREDMPALPTVAAKAFKVRWSGAAARLDDEFLAAKDGKLKVATEAIRPQILAPP
jgi:diacylglycerol kinase family enzyme